MQVFCSVVYSALAILLIATCGKAASRRRPDRNGTITLLPTQQKLGKGENAVMKCHFPHDSITKPINAKVKWTLNGRKIHLGHPRRIISGHRLFIFSAEYKDAGNYSCIIKGRKSNVAILAIPRPVIVKESDQTINLTVNLGFRASLTAHVRNSENIALLVWSHGDEQLLPSKRISMETTNTSVRLNIRRIRQRDAGRYQLLVVSRDKTIRVNFHLTVAKRPFPPANFSYTETKRCPRTCLKFSWKTASFKYQLSFAEGKIGKWTIIDDVSPGVELCKQFKPGQKHKFRLTASNGNGISSSAPLLIYKNDCRSRSKSSKESTMNTRG
eukprot:m.4201 g.4201  ORF g.4201 m.4201 type:complete len:327 (+) comp10381_c0_seq2:76-1056(+)